MNFSNQRDNTIILKETGKVYQVAIEEIIYVNCDAYLSTFHLINKNNTITCSIILKNIEEKLNIYGFFRISRNTIVNMRYFKCFSQNKRSFELISGESFQVSRRRWSHFNNKLTN